MGGVDGDSSAWSSLYASLYAGLYIGTGPHSHSHSHREVLVVIEEGAHIPSHPITNQHTAAPAIHFKANFGDRFLRKKIPPVGCSVDTQPPFPPFSQS